MEELNDKLNKYFAGKVVRKDLTKKIKEGANVPVYVLEYLLGMYCATNDEQAINDGVNTVKRILADNFVRPDEAEKIKAMLTVNRPMFENPDLSIVMATRMGIIKKTVLKTLMT